MALGAFSQIVMVVLVVTCTVMGDDMKEMADSGRQPHQPQPGAQQAGSSHASGSRSSYSYSYSSSSSHGHQSGSGSSSRSSQAGASQGGQARSEAAASRAHGADQASHSSGAQDAARRASSRRESARARSSSSSSSSSSALSSDLDQGSYFRQLISRRCKDCIVNGQTYKGHSRFEYTEDCQQHRCVCNCNGTHSCPPRYMLNVCKDGEDGEGRGASRQHDDQRRRRCNTCEVLGQQFEGNAYFDYEDGCTKYRSCVCYCNGTWVCPSERAVDTCGKSTPAPQSQCRACQAKGKVVTGNSVFELEEPCLKYRYCRCYCNGSWDCPARFAENTCQSPTAPPQQYPGCQTCSTPSNPQVPGNTYFDMKDGCTQYKNCVCRCNGSWSCPSQYARNVCQEPSTPPPTPARSQHHLPAGSAGCQSCLAYRRYFRGNSYFSTRRGCLKYERCVCRCDGSWDCPDRYVTDLCRDADPDNDVDNPNVTCSFCEAQGEIVPPNSFFNVTKDCVQYTHCLCHCDGAWTCPAKFSRNVCQSTPQHVSQEPEPEKKCSNCHLDSRVVRGNSYFDFTSACFRYRECLCKCDGTYHCEESRAENICNYTSTSSAGSSSSSSSSSAALVTPPAGSQCMRCLAWGQLQHWNTDFVHEENCVEYECHCHCNGTYTCPSERARRTCQNGCQECQVGGQFFEGNTYFQHTQGCVVYLCTCFCNGSYSCPPERANNTCGEGEEHSGVTPAAFNPNAQNGNRESGGQGGGQCQQCVVKDGSKHPGDSDFQLQEGCITYQCRCHCDGSWNCPGPSARNTCRGEVLGGCRSCVLSDSQIYRGGEPFQMRDGCIHYQCTCNCDGSWNCPGETARDICLGEVPGGCRVCRVSRNETYRGGSPFQLRQGCHHYQCQCHCNGSWECPGHTARDVCMGEVPGGCRVCKLESGQVYLGESDFQMEKNCVHYQCRCNCDGSWNCPGSRARRVCNADGSPLQAPTTPPPPDRSSCRRCVVSDQESFAPYSPFSLQRGCYRYQCRCECDGSWNCPADQAVDQCQRRDSPELKARTCTPCRVSEYIFPGRSSFLLTRGCAQYACHCDCQGRWTCDHSTVTNLCLDDNRGGQGGWRRRVSVSAQAVSDPSLVSVSSQVSPHSDYRSLVSNSASSGAISSAKGSSVAAANVGSFQMKRVSAPCRPCRVEGRHYDPNTDFVLEKKCKRFHCRCSCNGRWRCPRDRTENTCREDRYRERVPQQPASSGQQYGRADVRIVGAKDSSSSSSSSSSFHSSSSSSSSSSRGHQGQGHQYGRDNIRVVGADDASSSSLNQRRDGDQQQGRGNVYGYYVNSQDPYLQRGGARRQVYYQQADSRGRGQQGQGQAHRGQGQQQARGQEASGLSEAFFSQNQEVIEASSSSDGDGVVSLVEKGRGGRGGGVEVQEGGQQCSPCQVDDKEYRMGAKFDWRRGCVIYKCSCLCSGSYRCRLSVDPDPDCREAEAPQGSAGIPTGPMLQGRPASQPGGSCGNCYVQGFVYPGNMSFNLRQNCQEVKCHCDCGGTHQCSDDQRPIPGCVAVSTPLGGAVFAAAHSVYPLGGGAFAVRPGRGFQCPSCDPNQQGGGRIVMPAVMVPVYADPQHLPGQDPRHPLSRDGSDDHRQAQALRSGPSGVQYAHMESAAPAVQAAYKDLNPKCAICFVNGEARQGAFRYTTECSHVTCQCDCSGRLYCSVQQAITADCPAPLSDPRASSGGQCSSCHMQNRQVAGDEQFALRLGCYGYVCTCGCEGRWACAGQQPTNYCVKPPGAVEMDQHQNKENRVDGGNPSHHQDRAALQDFTMSRSADDDERDNPHRDNSRLLRCEDCDVRGTTYPSRSPFLLRDGCLQHTCHCHCNASWACDPQLTVDVCQQRRQEEEGDKDHPSASGKECKPCRMDGQVIRSRAAFNRKSGCMEWLCHCGCNGTASCPKDRSINTCDLATPDNPQGDSRPRKGCTVGRKTFFTRLFAYSSGCKEHMCLCYDSGSWRCLPGKERNLCK